MKPSWTTHGWRAFDWPILLSALMLSLIGLATIYSVDLSRGADSRLFMSQLIALGISIIVMLIAASFHNSFYFAHAKLFYGVALIMLIAVLIFGTTIRGTTGWFRVGAFSFQPAEFAKIALIIFLAWRVERQGRRFEKKSFILVTALVTGILAGLILSQPDIGSATILFLIWFGLLLLLKTKKRHLLVIVACMLAGFLVGWFFLFQEYQKERLLTFMNPERDPLGSGYNVTQSIIAIGSGGLAGRGLGFGSQSQLHFLPEAQTDFIFSVIGEELGFIGTAVVLALYLLLLYRLIRIARYAKNDGAVYTTLGIALLFLSHIIINIGAALGLLPVTGVTLPLVSYGGSSLLMNFFAVGIAESIALSGS